MVTKKQILKKIEEVIDPELNISIVDLGLIYEVKTKRNSVGVTMTFTTPACPLVPLIGGQVESKLFELGFKDVHVHVTWDPPWNVNMMSKRGRAALGL